MNKKHVAAILEEVGVLLELKGENPFKIRAYYNAAKAIENQAMEPAELVSTGQLSSLKGIGEAISLKISELVTTGRLNYHEELLSCFPEELIGLLSVPGLGPRKVRSLFERLGIQTLGELEIACLQNQLVSVEGFGKKSQEKILQGIHFLHQHKGRVLISSAIEQARTIQEALESHPGVLLLSLAGSLRRQKETIQDIKFVASTGNPMSLLESFARLPQVDRVLAKDDIEVTVLLKSGIQADLHLVSDTQFPFVLHHLTGSREHNAALNCLAGLRGMKLVKYGLFHNEVLIPCEDEEQIFERCGLAFIPPELRENLGEIEAAGTGGLPKLVEARDLRGTFHVHTTYSDGRTDLKPMVQEAIALGYQYVGISDHSQSAFYARGLRAQDIRRQHEEIDELNAEFSPFRIFKGIEADILADGTLDYPDEILHSFDFVIASIHSRFNLSKEQMTSRICAALRNRYVTMLAHPTGRLLLSREPYLLDMEAVIQTAVCHQVIIEINSHPSRLDLDWRVLKYAKELGMLTSINPDAHGVEGYRDMVYGVGVARKGWLEAKDVFNTRPLAEVVDYFERKRSAS